MNENDVSIGQWGGAILTILAIASGLIWLWVIILFVLFVLYYGNFNDFIFWLIVIVFIAVMLSVIFISFSTV